MAGQTSSQRSLRTAVAVQAVFLLVLLVAVFPGFFLRGELIVPGDLLFQTPPWDRYAPPGWERPHNRLMSDVVTAFMPYYAVTRQALDAGEWPLWNPLELGGMPLLANCQSAVFYPPRLLHAFLDIYLATSWYIVLKLWLCGMTAFFCALGLRLSMPTARFFSVAWMMASYNLVWCNWSLPDVSVWLPVLFAGTEFVLRGEYRRGVITTALGGTLILLAGHPETAFAMSLGLGFYFVFRLVLERRRGAQFWRPVLASLGGWAIALLVCAAQLAPFIEYLTHSSTFFERRGEDYTPWLPPGALATFWVPRFFGTYADYNYWGSDRLTSNPYMMIYPGMAVWIGLTLLLAKGDRAVPRHRVTALLLATGLCLLFAFQFPGFEFINRLPVFSSMVVFYHSAFPVFALPLLGALGVEHWFGQSRRLREVLWVLPLVLVSALVLTFLTRFSAGLMHVRGVTDYVHHEIAMMALFTMLGLLPFAIHGLWRRPVALVAAATLVLGVDLLVANRGMNPTMERRYIFGDTKLTTHLQNLEKPVRIGAGEGGIASGLLAPYGIEEMLGYDGLYPARIIQFQKGLARDLWNAMEPALSIQYYLHDPRYEPEFPLMEHPEWFEKVAELDGLEIYRNKRAFPRAFLVPQVQVEPDFERRLDIMRQAAFDPASTALVEAPLGDGPIDGVGDPGRARVTKRTSTHVEIDVDAHFRSVLVLGDSYFPGWRVTVNGEPSTLFPVYHALRGVVVPAGKAKVVYSYFPNSLRLGLGISLTACIAGIGWCLISLRRGGSRRVRAGVTVNHPVRRRS